MNKNKKTKQPSLKEHARQILNDSYDKCTLPKTTDAELDMLEIRNELLFHNLRKFIR